MRGKRARRARIVKHQNRHKQQLASGIERQGIIEHREGFIVAERLFVKRNKQQRRRLIKLSRSDGLAKHRP